MNANSIPAGRPTLKKDDILRGKFSQVQQFVTAVLRHLNLHPCEHDLGTLFAKDLYHLGNSPQIMDVRNIFRDYCNQLLCRIHVSELVINEPHFLLTPNQVDYIRKSYQTFKNNLRLIEEAKQKDFVRQNFTDPRDVTALELFTLDFANEIGKYARYRFASLKEAASKLFAQITAEEYCEYIEKVKVYKTHIENYGSILRSGPGVLPKRTKEALVFFYTYYTSIVMTLDYAMQYIDVYDSYYTPR